MSSFYYGNGGYYGGEDIISEGGYDIAESEGGFDETVGGYSWGGKAAPKKRGPSKKRGASKKRRSSKKRTVSRGRKTSVAARKTTKKSKGRTASKKRTASKMRSQPWGASRSGVWML